MTTTVRMVLAVLLDDPGGRHFGLELSGATGLAPGTVYPILHRLEGVGWLESRSETNADAAAQRRPARRYYELTRAGAERAPQRLAEHAGRFGNLARVLPGLGPVEAWS